MPVSPLAGDLAGITVIDLTRNLAGPFCTMLLGDMGADVIKVETPGTGDDTRSWGPAEWGGQSATFLSCNRNKRSIAIDLDMAAGQEIVKRLASTADVVVSSFRPDSLVKRRLDSRSLREINPGLIYCSISAYGPKGPSKDRPGYDPVLQADTGIMALTGYPEAPPARLGIGAIDLGTAMWASVGIQAALRTRAVTGVGSLVEVSLYETAAWWLSYHVAGFLASGVDPQRHGAATSFIAPYETFGTSDGDLMVSAGNDRLFAQLCDLLDLPELADDAAFATNADRVTNREVLHDRLEQRFRQRPATEWEILLSGQSIPCGRVRTVADLVQDEQLAALGMLINIPHPDIPDLRLIATPMSIDGERATRLQPPPRLGEQTDAILDEIGLTPAEIADLRTTSVVA
ncbi:MAG: CoA transferase [Actinomycetota bacterium]|nr:CoA transferase [Actinomycetota bacterium]